MRIGRIHSYGIQVNAAPDPNFVPIEKHEKRLVLILCVVAALRVLIYSAAFPFFGPVDEEYHFDLVVRYSRWDVPRKLEPFSPAAVPYLVYYGSVEYLPAKLMPEGKYPEPPWVQPAEQARIYLESGIRSSGQIRNYECTQPPLYYVLTGFWWQLGRVLNLNDGNLLYGIRFTNALIVIAVVLMGYASARLLFPDRQFVRLATAALLAFLPQSAFYSIENDALSPVCFGAVFLLLLGWMCGRTLTPGLAAAIGLAMAATFLTKLTNAPLLAVAAVVILLQLKRMAGEGTLRAVLPAVGLMVLCAGVPVAAWLGWMKHHFGDFTGEAVHAVSQGWAHKPAGQWLHHPIFTPTGLWTFASSLLASFWNGELVWHGQPMNSRIVNLVFALLSLLFLGLGVRGIISNRTILEPFQRRALWMSLACIPTAMVFLGLISLPYDFQDCLRPSRALPYFFSGRLMLGAVVPFFLVFVYGLDQASGRGKMPWTRPLILSGIILFMLITELVANRPVFSSGFNWFHM